MSNAKVSVGDIIKFGWYPQDHDLSNGAETIARRVLAVEERFQCQSVLWCRETIAWRVLAVEEGSALVVSVMSLDAKPYHDWWANVTWEKCALRAWLNNEFYNVAFDDRERAMIERTHVVNEDNQEYLTKGGNDTEDFIFLLSIAEMEKYFKDREDRIAKPTAYAIANGAWTNRSRTSAWWWLRSPGRKRFEAADVHPEGDVMLHGGCGTIYEGVRPALWINYMEYLRLEDDLPLLAVE